MYTHIIMLVDRSGSMSNIKNDMQGGIKEFIEKQKLEPGKCTMTFARFNHTYEKMFQLRDINDTGNIDLDPAGSTALIDSMCQLIHDGGRELAELPANERPDKVLFVTITDGEENCSSVYTRQQLFEMIKHQEEKYNWSFVYIGANQDSFTNAASVGIHVAQAANYTATSVGVTNAFASLTSATVRYRKSATTDLFSYTPEEQALSSSDEPTVTTSTNTAP